VELLIVVLMAGVLAMMALPPLFRSQQRLRLESAVQQLQEDLWRARSDAVARSAPVTLVPTGAAAYSVTFRTPRSLPNGTLFSGTGAGVTFTSYGTSSADSTRTFVLSAAGATRQVVVNPAGFVRVQ
jgi:type II secretory pathway pseudopilin PulG